MTGYDKQLSQYLLLGFRTGFKLKFEGHREFRTCRNLVSAYQKGDIVANKLNKEVSLGRIAGPFLIPPFPTLQCSPIGVVPKKEPGEFRMIHHLSYPEGKSINDSIPNECCSVTYSTVDDAVALIKKLGTGCLLAKTDIASAFRIIPIHPSDHELLGIHFKGFYYYDKCLPMGSSISCAIFEAFSSALQWVAINKLGVSSMVHVLDDFLFLGPKNSSICALSLQQFISLCEALGVPIKDEKTEGPSSVLTFLGIELDTVMMEARLPVEKVVKVRNLLSSIKKRKKVTLRELQSLLGLLNFCCQVVVPGRAFLRRLTNLTKGKCKPHHHIRLNKAARLDMHAWSTFIDSYNGKSIFLDDKWQDSDKLHLFTDASGLLGYGAVFGSRWFYGMWKECKMQNHHITVKELFPIVLAVEIWGVNLQNQSVMFHSDNRAVVDVINKTSSKDSHIMQLVRRLVLICLRYNILFQAIHIPGKMNVLPDLLSRLQVSRFKKLAESMDPNPTKIPTQLLHL